MRFRPLRGKLLVERDASALTSFGGIHIADPDGDGAPGGEGEWGDGEDRRPKSGVVVSVGDDVDEASPGDRVWWCELGGADLSKRDWVDLGSDRLVILDEVSLDARGE